MRWSKVNLVLSALFFSTLASCQSVPENIAFTQTATITQTISPTQSSTVHSTIVPSNTPVPCDPERVEYCILPGNFEFQVPIAPPGTGSVDRSYAFGSTSGGERPVHRGVEFYNGTGTPVLAAGAGTVLFEGDDSETLFSAYPGFYGNLVVVEHEVDGLPLFSLYCHLSKIKVSTGDLVSVGEEIAEVGSSGSAIGSHLHFEIRSSPYDENSVVNPELWLMPLPGTGVVAMRFIDKGGNFVQVQPNIQYYPDRNGVYTQAWQPEPYAPAVSQVSQWENVVLGNLIPGSYRITYIWEGHLSERWIEIQPGKLTLTAFEVP